METLYYNDSECYGSPMLGTAADFDDLDREFNEMDRGEVAHVNNWREDRLIRVFNASFVLHFYRQRRYTIDETLAESIRAHCYNRFFAGERYVFADDWDFIFEEVSATQKRIAEQGTGNE